MGFFKFAIELFLSMVYPNRCAGCNVIIAEDELFCDYCYEMLPVTAADKRCRTCGCKIKECQCRYRVFHFTSVTAPFYNSESAQKAMYAFKFNRKIYYGDFLARQMVLAVKGDFFDIKLDGVVYVPLPIKREIKRGYNQSRELAIRIARLLDIPLIENALGCNTKRMLQHKTYLKDRFSNVKGCYYPNISLKGRRLLLVDDIKTTGATLDECSRTLLKAGAYEVYCVTGLITTKNKKKGK